MKKLRMFILVSLSILLFTSYGLAQAAPVDLNEASVEQLAELPDDAGPVVAGQSAAGEGAAQHVRKLQHRA